MNAFVRTAVLMILGLVMPTLVMASGYGIFTQGASGLGQANAVVAHTTGPSSVYFNPALINDVPGRQIEVGTTAVYSDRDIDYTGGGSENGDSAWNFPSTFYYTHQANDKLTSGLGIFFPFGLSNEWDDHYDGRYIGTSGEMLTVNINPAVSYRVTDRLSLAVGLGIAIPLVLGSVAVNMLEIFVAFLQAFIFTFLTTLFIGMMVTGDHGEHHEEAHA